jgi:3-isopropylmalate/(R)-2-methylmalate dehydratase large subunit
MGKTFAEKIFSMKANGQEVSPGNMVTITPDVVVVFDGESEVFYRFEQLGIKKVWDPSRVICFLDHYTPPATVETATLHKKLREFAKEKKIKQVYDMGEGIGHEIMLEKGHVMPGQFVVGHDSHTTAYGSVGAFSCGIGATDMLYVLSMGHLWFKVPESVKITVKGKMPPGVYAKDIALEVIRNLTTKGCTYDCIEYSGETFKELDMSDRTLLTTIAVEMGAKATYVQFDQLTQTYVERNDKTYARIFPDADASYKKYFELNVERLTPMVACPHSVDNVRSIKEVEKTEIHYALIGTCTGGRLKDLEIAARLLRRKKIHPGVRLIIVPASRTILLKGMELGYVQDLLSAGGTFITPGCGPCAGIQGGLLGDGECCISTGNRNFMGRMGSLHAKIYLASTATVAVSALFGVLTDPREYI